MEMVKNSVKFKSLSVFTRKIPLLLSLGGSQSHRIIESFGLEKTSKITDMIDMIMMIHISS